MGCALVLGAAASGFHFGRAGAQDDAVVSADRSSSQPAPQTNAPAGPTATPTRSGVAQQQQAAYARRSFLAAEDYLVEKSLARKVVALLDEGKPWAYIDGTTDRASDEFRTAYAAWRSAEVRAGRDVKVSGSEMEALTRLAAIRQAIGQFRAKNNRPPTLGAIASLPPNPFTGQRGVARSGRATPSHGWSYDEAAGRIRIVLPAGKYAGLTEGEIEPL